MTTENRTGQFVPLEEAPKTDSFSQIISQARSHGEQMLVQGMDPQVASVAVHERLLHNFTDSQVHRRVESPFDVTVLIEGEKHLVFLDIECHQIVWEVLRYLASENLEAKSWN